MRKNQRKSSKKPLENKQTILLIVVAGVILFLLGVLVAYLVLPKSNDIRFGRASSDDIAAAKNAAYNMYFVDDATKCDDSHETTRVNTFNKYFKVNKYGNRAVARGCADSDTLFAKDPLSGVWHPTIINMSLDKRANPIWQVECMIEDITVADTVVRSENSTIDTYNLVGCRQLKEKELMVKILKTNSEKDGFDLTTEDIKEYIKGAESFHSI